MRSSIISKRLQVALDNISEQYELAQPALTDKSLRALSKIDMLIGSEVADEDALKAIAKWEDEYLRVLQMAMVEIGMSRHVK